MKLLYTTVSQILNGSAGKFSNRLANYSQKNAIFLLNPSFRKTFSSINNNEDQKPSLSNDQVPKFNLLNASLNNPNKDIFQYSDNNDPNTIGDLKKSEDPYRKPTLEQLLIVKEKITNHVRKLSLFSLKNVTILIENILNSCPNF
jgi:hypothetical protein